MESRVHFESEHEIVATVGSVLVWIDRTKASDADSSTIHKVKEVFDGPLANAPATAMLLVMHEGTPLPAGETRDNAAKLFDDLGERFRGLTVVLVGGGFWASALRSAVTGVGLKIARRMPLRVFTSVEAGTSNVAEQLPGVDAGKLGEAYESLLAHLED